MCVRQYSYLRVVCLCGNYILHYGKNIVYTFLTFSNVALDIIARRPPSPKGRVLERGRRTDKQQFETLLNPYNMICRFACLSFVSLRISADIFNNFSKST
jgi:hypothetical protein